MRIDYRLVESSICITKSCSILIIDYSKYRYVFAYVQNGQMRIANLMEFLTGLCSKGCFSYGCCTRGSCSSGGCSYICCSRVVCSLGCSSHGYVSLGCCYRGCCYTEAVAPEAAVTAAALRRLMLPRLLLLRLLTRLCYRCRSSLTAVPVAAAPPVATFP